MLQFFQGAKLTEADRRYSVYDFYYRVKKIEKVCAKEELDGIASPLTRRHTHHHWNR
jgi:hypothetical protein